MKRPSITYDVEPSFDEHQRLRVEIAWVDRRGKFMLDVKKGLQQNRRLWFDANEDIDNILRDSAALQLPVSAEGPIGLDGTVFHFTIGSTPSVTFSWWMDMPSEWTALQSIVDHIDRVVDQEFA
jgi:hypothetical protein